MQLDLLLHIFYFFLTNYLFKFLLEGGHLFFCSKNKMVAIFNLVLNFRNRVCSLLFLLIFHKQFAFYIKKPSFCVCKVLLHIFINCTRILNKLKAHNFETPRVSKPIDCFNQVKTLNFCSW